MTEKKVIVRVPVDPCTAAIREAYAAAHELIKLAFPEPSYGQQKDKPEQDNADEG